MRMILDDSDNIPVKVDIFLDMRDVCKGMSSYVDFNEAVKNQSRVVKDSDEDIDNK
jgi:hypothetical protein